MKNRILFILVLVLLLSFSFKVSANESCSTTGYTILTINGIFTDETGAIENKNKLKNKFSKIYNNQPLTIDYLYNPSHLAGLGDLVDVVAQGLFDQKSDYDLTEMLNDASQKVTTQKLLLVAHSQGNFYANNFYDKVADQTGGVPKNSIGVYSVATPANRVAGEGKYLTSDTDKVIATLAGRVFSIMTPNVHIPLQNGDDNNGHDFSSVYLKYESSRIISDIQSSLNKLSANTIQDTQKPCIAPPKLTIIHKIEKVALAVADPIANVTKSTATAVYNSSSLVANTGANAIAWLYNQGVSLAKNTIGGLSGNNLASVAIQEEQSQAINTANEPLPYNPEPQDITINSTENQSVQTQTENDIVINIPNQESPVAPQILPAINQIIYHGGGSSPAPNTETEMPATETPPADTTPPLDTTAPVISIIGDNPATIDVNSAYTDLGATAIDDIDGTLAVSTTGVDTIDTATVGAYTVTYTATDLSNNIATSTRIVNVVQPAITVPDPNSANKILAFSFNNLSPNVSGIINEVSYTIYLPVLKSTNLTALVPTILISNSAYISPNSGVAQDFTNPVTYTVTAIDGSTQEYIVSVIPSSAGQQIDFDSSNNIAIVGQFLLCNYDNYTNYVTGTNGGLSSYISSTNWRTPYQQEPNSDMPVNKNFRFIFGVTIDSLFDCEHGTHMNDYSNSFYYATSDGSSVVYGSYVDTTPPAPDTTLPAVINYTFNGSSANITTNPISNHLPIVINVNKDVNWISIKIENQNNSSIYKYFYPGGSCDEKATCSETWDGLLSSGGLLQNGTYRIKVHIKDNSNNQYNDYLTPYVITVDNSL
jgi:hypothetical protein